MHPLRRELWEDEHLSHPRIEVDPATGERTVRDAGEWVKTRPEWWRHQVVYGHSLASVVQADGTLRLDSAGRHVYVPTDRVAVGPFILYRKVPA